MILLSDFIIGIKRDCNYGDESTTSDQPTLDIIRSLNYRYEKICKKHAWDWLTETFNVTITSGSQDITLSATIDRVIAIGDNSGKYLKKISIKEALRWHTPALNEDNINIVGYYINLGRDSVTGAKKIRVYGNPSSSGVLPAYGIKVVSKFAVSDIATANMLPMTDDVVGVLKDFICADIERIQGKPDWRMDKQAAERDLLTIIGDDQSDPSDDVTSPLPDMLRNRLRLRRAGHVA